MNALNRLLMILLSLLMIGIPIVILLTGLGIIPGSSLNSIFGYNNALTGLPRMSRSDVSSAAIWVGIAGIVIGLVAIALILRELAFQPHIAHNSRIQDDPGSEVVITPRAVQHIVEGAVRDAGGVSPKISLNSKRNLYEISCEMLSPDADRLAEVAQRARESIQVALNSQTIPHEITSILVRGNSNTTSRLA